MTERSKIDWAFWLHIAVGASGLASVLLQAAVLLTPGMVSAVVAGLSVIAWLVLVVTLFAVDGRNAFWAVFLAAFVLLLPIYMLLSAVGLAPAFVI